MILGDLFEGSMKRVMDTVQDFVELTDKEFIARHGISPVAWVKQNQSLLSSIADQYPTIKKYIPAPDAHLFQEDVMVENLRKWFREKWVRFNPQGKIMGPCARGSDREGKPKCLPQAKAHALGKKGRASAAAKKRREDPNPERRGPARNVATKVKEQGVAEGVELKFHTIELNESQIQPYVKKYFECYNIEKPYTKSVSNIKKFGSNKLIESNESQEINSFIQMINSVDSNKTIKVGDHFAVLAFEILFAWKEINASGFTTPKEVADIKMHNDGTINYIKFSDGDRYPRLTPATYQGKPIIQTAYFDNQSRAKSALTALVLKVPNGWEFNTADVEQGVAEGFLGDREYNRVMPFVKRIAGEVSDYDRDEFGEELWSLLDQKYGSKFAQSVLDDLDIYWDTYTELTDQQGVAETFIRPENAREQQAQILARTYAELYWGDRSITERVRTAREIFRALESGELDMATLKMEIRALEQEHDLDEGIFGFSEEQLDEKQDACYHKVKARYKVWPSAYASGALVQCRKKGAANWGKGSKKK